MRTRTVEWLLAALMVGWGIFLLMPWTTFDAPLYHWLALLAGERTWGSFSVAIGALRMVALYINGSWRRTPLIRAFAAVMGLIWWIVIGFLISFGVHGAPPADLLFFPIFAYFEAYSCYRSGQDAHDYGSLRRGRHGRVG
jgi:hypothetical protein